MDFVKAIEQSEKLGIPFTRGGVTYKIGIGAGLIVASQVDSKVTKAKLLEDTHTVGSFCFEASNITEVILNDGLRHIGTKAFTKCTKLKKINIPSSVEAIGTGAFDGAGLTSIKLDDVLLGMAAFTHMPKLQTAEISNCGDKAAYLFAGCTKLKKVILHNVECVSVSMFRGCSHLREVVSESCISVDRHAFTDCHNLVSVDFEISSVGERSFMWCTKLKHLNLRNCTKIMYEAFRDSGIECADLRNVQFLHRNIFAHCTELQSIVCPMKLLDTSWSLSMALKELNIDERPLDVYICDGTDVGILEKSRTKLVDMTRLIIPPTYDKLSVDLLQSLGYDIHIKDWEASEHSQLPTTYRSGGLKNSLVDYPKS